MHLHLALTSGHVSVSLRPLQELSVSGQLRDRLAPDAPPNAAGRREGLSENQQARRREIGSDAEILRDRHRGGER
jgi:hypothetical protein